jgi:hypothetical protein
VWLQNSSRGWLRSTKCARTQRHSNEVIDEKIHRAYFDERTKLVCIINSSFGAIHQGSDRSG